MDDIHGIIDVTSPIEWSHPLNNGLVGCWTVIPNSGWRGALTLRDLVRGGKSPHDGVLNGGVSFSSSNLNFDGGVTTGVRIPSTTLLKPTNTITVSAMVFVNTFLAWDKVMCLDYRANGTWTSPFTVWELILEQNNDAKPSFGITTSSTNHTYAQSGVTISTGKWYHLVGLYDGPNSQAIKIYINGVVQGTSNAIGTPVNIDYGSSADFAIGRDSFYGGSTPTNEQFNGLLQSVQIYNRVLNSTEIASLYDQSSRGHPDTFRRIRRASYFIQTTTPPVSGTFNPSWTIGCNVIVGGGVNVP